MEAGNRDIRVDDRQSIGSAPSRVAGELRLHAALAVRLRRVCRLALALGVATTLVASAPAIAASFRATSHTVALVPSRGLAPPPPLGQMPITGTVSGIPSDSFDQFRFVNVPLASITAQTLQHFDTVVLMQVSTDDLSATHRATLAQFVIDGGKLIIHDSDETTDNDYSWLPYPGRIGGGCSNCASRNGVSTILANNGLISANPTDPSYVNLAELAERTDAIGDANLFVTRDPHWSVSATATAVNGDVGATVASASDNGLMVYNGYDTDFVRPSSAPGAPWPCVDGAAPTYDCPPPASGIDWLAKMWYDELAQSWGTASPALTAPSALAVGQTVDPARLDAPSGLRCVVARKLSFSFHKLRKHIRRADVYVNGRHVLRRKARKLTHLTVTRLPKKGGYTVKIILTTQRGFHLIMHRRYRACRR
jgi:hypothetical protein